MQKKEIKNIPDNRRITGATIIFSGVILIIFLRVFATEIFLVDTPSMMPTIQPTEVFIVDKLSGGTSLPRRFADIPIVNVFTWIKPLRERDAKRDWGLHTSRQFRPYKPGDIIVFYASDHNKSTLIKRIHHVIDDAEGTRYYVLGDNNTNSIDSRSFGPIANNRIVGRAIMVVFSWDKDAAFLKKIRWKRMFRILE